MIDYAAQLTTNTMIDYAAQRLISILIVNKNFNKVI